MALQIAYPSMVLLLSIFVYVLGPLSNILANQYFSPSKPNVSPSLPQDMSTAVESTSKATIKSHESSRALPPLQIVPRFSQRDMYHSVSIDCLDDDSDADDFSFISAPTLLQQYKSQHQTEFVLKSLFSKRSHNQGWIVSSPKLEAPAFQFSRVIVHGSMCLLSILFMTLHGRFPNAALAFFFPSSEINSIPSVFFTVSIIVRAIVLHFWILCAIGLDDFSLSAITALLESILITFFSSTPSATPLFALKEIIFCGAYFISLFLIMGSSETTLNLMLAEGVLVGLAYLLSRIPQNANTFFELLRDDSGILSFPEVKEKKLPNVKQINFTPQSETLRHSEPMIRLQQGELTMMDLTEVATEQDSVPNHSPPKDPSSGHINHPFYVYSPETTFPQSHLPFNYQTRFVFDAVVTLLMIILYAFLASLAFVSLPRQYPQQFLSVMIGVAIVTHVVFPIIQYIISFIRRLMLQSSTVEHTQMQNHPLLGQVVLDTLQQFGILIQQWGLVPWIVLSHTQTTTTLTSNPIFDRILIIISSIHILRKSFHNPQTLLLPIVVTYSIAISNPFPFHLSEVMVMAVTSMLLPPIERFFQKLLHLIQHNFECFASAFSIREYASLELYRNPILVLLNIVCALIFSLPSMLLVFVTSFISSPIYPLGGSFFFVPSGPSHTLFWSDEVHNPRKALSQFRIVLAVEEQTVRAQSSLHKRPHYLIQHLRTVPHFFHVPFTCRENAPSYFRMAVELSRTICSFRSQLKLSTLKDGDMLLLVRLNTILDEQLLIDSQKEKSSPNRTPFQKLSSVLQINMEGVVCLINVVSVGYSFITFQISVLEISHYKHASLELTRFLLNTPKPVPFSSPLQSHTTLDLMTPQKNPPSAFGFPLKRSKMEIIGNTLPMRTARPTFESVPLSSFTSLYIPFEYLLLYSKQSKQLFVGFVIHVLIFELLNWTGMEDVLHNDVILSELFSYDFHHSFESITHSLRDFTPDRDENHPDRGISIASFYAFFQEWVEICSGKKKERDQINREKAKQSKKRHESPPPPEEAHIRPPEQATPFTISTEPTRRHQLAESDVGSSSNSSSDYVSSVRASYQGSIVDEDVEDGEEDEEENDHHSFSSSSKGSFEMEITTEIRLCYVLSIILRQILLHPMSVESKDENPNEALLHNIWMLFVNSPSLRFKKGLVFSSNEFLSLYSQIIQKSVLAYLFFHASSENQTSMNDLSILDELLSSLDRQWVVTSEENSKWKDTQLIGNKNMLTLRRTSQASPNHALLWAYVMIPQTVQYDAFKLNPEAVRSIWTQHQKRILVHKKDIITCRADGMMMTNPPVQNHIPPCPHTLNNTISLFSHPPFGRCSYVSSIMTGYPLPFSRRH
ncbi:hypothetical protein BLNAU_10244 [Blattamonas nauphoetae]|uniref:Pecanex C-terminal domain-containing protein n=1 Tax=Blattamonas nauphoetae TaxID=2049346 RepID=A0ABQ9XTF7_9EUKA|nr:hypothetical protein BLNAU_10244 [Blattamonas nauphoetae]